MKRLLFLTCGLVAACQAAPAADPATADVSAWTATQASAPAVRWALAFAPTFHVQDLSSPWTQATVSLYDGQVNGPYSPTLYARTLPYAAASATAGGSLYTTTVAMPGLRPDNRYVARAFLNAGALLAGSAESTQVELLAGANTLSLTVTPAGPPAAITTGSSFTAGDAVNLATGFAAHQPGVARVDLRLSGAAYGDSQALVASLTDPATFDAFSWDTASDATGVSGPYQAAQLVSGSGQLTFTAYTDHDEQVGQASVSLDVQ